MTITAKIIADSVSPEGIRLTTMSLRYPRFIHAEFMTHRMFSRNASSSRAIPVERLIQDVIDDPVYPSFWGKNQKGMQAKEELEGDCLTTSMYWWDRAREEAIHFAQLMSNEGVHKQIVNRVLEPFSHINVLVTSTDFANFYALRRHPDAQPEIQELANAMWEAQQASTPKLLHPTMWHLPYITERDLLLPETESTLRKVSVARCARVSYLTHEGTPTSIEDDLALYGRLVGGDHIHASPTEHQATPDTCYNHGTHNEFWERSKQWGNFRGWVQFRKTLPNEHVKG